MHRKVDVLASLCGQLKEYGLKVTDPRKAILLVLIENHGPFTAEEIHRRVKRGLCDLATVYRCLTSMEEAKILRRCEFGDGTARYELAEKDDHHHHHVICISCKKVEPLEDCDLGDINKYAQNRGFSDVSHALEFFGKCAACQ